MSGSASLTLEQGILQHTLGIAAMAFPAQVYVALCAAGLPPSESVGGVEAFGGGYSRVAATFALLASPTNVAANTVSLEYPLATAAWGSLGYFEIWSAQTGGSRLYWGGLVDPVSGNATTLNVSAGDIVRFSAGTLAVEVAAPTAAVVSGVSSFNTRTGAVTLSNSDVVAVLPPSANPPLMDGTAAVGTSAAWARGDHVHPSDVSWLSGGTLTGPLTLVGNATLPLQAVPLQQVDTLNMVNVLNHGAIGNGVANDTVAIQNVLTTYAGKATILIPETGHPYLVAGFAIPSGTDLLLQGHLLCNPAQMGHLLKLTNVSNVTIRGTGIVDGNWANLPPAYTWAGIDLNGCTNVFISGVTVRDSSLWNFAATASSHIRVDGVTLIGGQYSNGFNTTSTDCWFTNSLVDGTVADGGFAFYGGTAHSGAIGNTVRNCGPAGNAGIYIDADSGQPNPCSNIVIADNIVYNTGGAGIWCDNFSGVVHTGVIIANNRCHGNGQVTSPSDADIHVGNTNDALIIGNTSTRMGNSTVQQSGISVTGGAGVSVIGNHVSDVGIGGTAGIGLNINNTNKLYVASNHFWRSTGNTSMVLSINGPCGTANSFIGNFCELPVNATAATDTIAANVVGGNWTLGIGNKSAAEYLEITARAGYQTNLLYAANSVPRWAVGTDGLAETGSDAGANLQIASFTDGGAAKAVMFTARRDINRITLGTGTVLATVATQACENAAGQIRWYFGNDGANETGGSAGSSFEIISVLDNNTTATQVLRIDRATSATTLTGPLYVPYVRTGGAAGPSWTTGSVAPATNEPVGSLYSRVGGAVGATLYVSRGAGVWNPIAGV